MFEDLRATVLLRANLMITLYIILCNFASMSHIPKIYPFRHPHPIFGLGRGGGDYVLLTLKKMIPDRVRVFFLTRHQPTRHRLFESYHGTSSVGSLLLALLRYNQEDPALIDNFCISLLLFSLCF